MVGATIENEIALEVPPAGAGLNTVTGTVPTEAISAAVIPAWSCVALTYEVTRALPFHCTIEQGRKFPPVTLNANATVPAVALNGEMDAIVGAGSDEAEIVKEAEAELTPELDTVIDAVPAEAISEAGMLAVSCVELTNVVTRAELFQPTTEPFTKFVPFTVRVNPEGLHDGVELDDVVGEDKDVMVGGIIVNAMEVGDVPPPGPSVSTTTCAVPKARNSAAGTVALSWVALT